ncbi:hypothetical protein GQX73_g8058 [Xylaria multiplex]|uniref:Uncharacterized protein n=1 Tax=Xylaria multiplex TaxID=323545 RepID=A0A7C8MTV8_9PEZI|nr:hypothetical protein GQX73_g8058 [Xylaria multiplex]
MRWPPPRKSGQRWRELIRSWRSKPRAPTQIHYPILESFDCRITSQDPDNIEERAQNEGLATLEPGNRSSEAGTLLSREETKPVSAGLSRAVLPKCKSYKTILDGVQPETDDLESKAHLPILKHIWTLAIGNLSNGSMEQKAAARRLEDLVASDMEKFREGLIDGVNIITHIQSLAKAKRNHISKRKSTWKLKLLGQEWSLIELAGRIVTWLDYFKEVGDVIASFDPHHIALPWAAIRFLLQAVTASQEQSVLACVVIDRVLHVLFRCEIYARLYFNQPIGRESSPSVNILVSSMTKLFTDTLFFLDLAVERLSNNSFQTSINDLFNPRQVADSLSTLAELERRLDISASMCHMEEESKRGADFERLCLLLDRSLASQGSQLGAINRTLHEDDMVKILQWVSSIAYETDFININQNRLEDTCEWLCGHPKYLDWLERDKSSIFWLHGIPGAGKTHLASKVVDTLSHKIKWRQDAILAYFFCDSNRHTHRNPHSLLCSLLTYIIIDGLDESELETRDRLMEVFQNLISQCKTPLKLFISSREDEDIKQQFRDGRDLRITAGDNQADIERFVVSRLGANRWCQDSLGDRTRKEIMRIFTEKSQGMFLWAKLMMDGLLKLKLEKDILQYVRNLPRGIKGAYDKIYHEIQDLEGSASEIADRAFQFLMCSWRPLEPEILTGLIALDLRIPGWGTNKQPISMDYVLDVCRNLVVVAAESNICRFAHLSVQEYFEQHHWSREHVNMLMSRICLQYFTTNKPLYYRPTWRIDSLPDISLPSADPQLERQEYFTLCQDYMAGWPHHWVRCKDHSKDEELLRLYRKLLGDLLRPSEYYIKWINTISRIDLKITRDLVSTARRFGMDITRSSLFTYCFLGTVDQAVQNLLESNILDPRTVKWLATNLFNLAIDRNDLELCKLYLSMGVDVNKSAGSIYVRPPLHLATRHGLSHIDIVEFLLENGADPNIETDYFGTALEGALDGKDPKEVIELLEKYGATFGSGRSLRLRDF